MSSTMTVRLDDAVKAQLEKLAEATQRSKSFRWLRTALRNLDAEATADPERMPIHQRRYRRYMFT